MAARRDSGRLGRRTTGIFSFAAFTSSRRTKLLRSRPHRDDAHNHPETVWLYATASPQLLLHFRPCRSSPCLLRRHAATGQQRPLGPGQTGASVRRAWNGMMISAFVRRLPGSRREAGTCEAAARAAVVRPKRDGPPRRRGAAHHETCGDGHGEKQFARPPNDDAELACAGGP